MRGGLTRRQAQLLAFIKSFSQEHGISPSTDEMLAALGLKGRSGAQRIVDALVERGFLTRVRGRHRSLVVVGDSDMEIEGTYAAMVRQIAVRCRMSVKEVIAGAIIEYATNHPPGETK